MNQFLRNAIYSRHSALCTYKAIITPGTTSFLKYSIPECLRDKLFLFRKMIEGQIHLPADLVLLKTVLWYRDVQA
jgi:hypothetical protein